MKIRPMFKRFIVFHVPVQRKTASGIYKSNGKRGSMSRAERVWIVSGSSQCTLDVKMGDSILIHDAFELSHIKLDLWDLYKDLPEFCGLRQFAENVDGDVKTKILTEDSLSIVDNEFVVEPVDSFTRYASELKTWQQDADKTEF